jgi:hypothetical protein
MQEFTKEPVCEKCGFEEISWTYTTQSLIFLNLKDMEYTYGEGCIVLTCQRCECDWAMKTKPEEKEEENETSP